MHISLRMHQSHGRSILLCIVWYIIALPLTDSCVYHHSLSTCVCEHHQGYVSCVCLVMLDKAKKAMPCYAKPCYFRFIGCHDTRFVDSPLLVFGHGLDTWMIFVSVTHFLLPHHLTFFLAFFVFFF